MSRVPVSKCHSRRFNRKAGYADKEEIIQSTVGAVLDELRDEQLPFEYLIYVGDFLNHRYKKPDTPNLQRKAD